MTSDHQTQSNHPGWRIETASKPQTKQPLLSRNMPCIWRYQTIQQKNCPSATGMEKIRSWRGRDRGCDECVSSSCGPEDVLIRWKFLTKSPRAAVAEIWCCGFCWVLRHWAGHSWKPWGLQNHPNKMLQYPVMGASQRHTCASWWRSYFFHRSCSACVGNRVRFPWLRRCERRYKTAGQSCRAKALPTVQLCSTGRLQVGALPTLTENVGKTKTQWKMLAYFNWPENWRKNKNFNWLRKKLLKLLREHHGDT